eukprot:358480-Amorphochlora_amoeboformis.AAC.1
MSSSPLAILTYSIFNLSRPRDDAEGIYGGVRSHRAPKGEEKYGQTSSAIRLPVTWVCHNKRYPGQFRVVPDYPAESIKYPLIISTLSRGEVTVNTCPLWRWTKEAADGRPFVPPFPSAIRRLSISLTFFYLFGRLVGTRAPDDPGAGRAQYHEHRVPLLQAPNRPARVNTGILRVFSCIFFPFVESHLSRVWVSISGSISSELAVKFEFNSPYSTLTPPPTREIKTPSCSDASTEF